MRMLFLLLLVMSASHSGRASIIVAVADYQLPPISYIVGMFPGGPYGQGLSIITTTQIMITPDYTPSQDIDLQLFCLVFHEMKLTPLSQVTSVNSNFPYTPIVDSGFIVSGLRNSMYEFDLQLEALVQNVGVLVAPIPDGIVYLNGTLYYQGQHVIYSVDQNTGVGTQVAAPNTYVTGSTTLAAGPDGKLYTIGQAIGNAGSCTAGQWCVIGMDPGDGSLVSGFPLAFNASTSVLTIGADGRFYLATGDGQGYLFDGGGFEAATLSSSAVNPDWAGGHTLLTLDGNGYLYMEDAATGLHVFDVSTPEPGAAGLTALGVLLLCLRKVRLRRLRITRITS